MDLRNNLFKHITRVTGNNRYPYVKIRGYALICRNVSARKIALGNHQSFRTSFPQQSRQNEETIFLQQESPSGKIKAFWIRYETFFASTRKANLACKMFPRFQRITRTEGSLSKKREAAKSIRD